MSILTNSLFLTGTALLAIALGRTALLVVGSIFLVLSLVSAAGVK
jgi:hypothetical protein